MMLQHMMDLQAMEIKYLKEELLAMKKITLQIQDTRTLQLENKMRLFESAQESLIKTNRVRHITKFFEDHFVMRVVMVYGANKVRPKRATEESC